MPNRDHYVLHRDDIGNIQQIITPKQLKHRLINVQSLSSNRLLYYSPEFKSPFVWIYNEHGRIIQQIYPSNYRYVTYIRDKSDELKKVIWDHSSIEIQNQRYTNEKKLLFKVVIATPRYKLAIERSFIANMLVESANNAEAGRLVNSKFKYNYDSNRRLTNIQSFIENDLKSTISIAYAINDNKSRFYQKLNDFEFLRDTFVNNELEIKDSNFNLNLRNDESAQLSEISLKIRNLQRFRAYYEYDEKSRLKLFSYKINENLFDEINPAFIKEKTYNYQYDANDRLLQVTLTTSGNKIMKIKDEPQNTEKLWQIYYDSHGNSILEDSKSLSKNRKQLNINLQINGADQLMILDHENSKTRYKFDVDGFIYRRIDSKEDTIFVHDSNQLLTKIKINSNNNKTIEYFYDHRSRLIARKHYTGYSIQYFYADEARPNLVTHVYDQNTLQFFTYYYTDDDRSRLFAVERNGVMFYIVTDLVNSPMLVYDAFGNIVNEYSYDPFGYEINIDDPSTALNAKFQLYLSFKSAIYDQEAGILFLKGGTKPYDPKCGRYLAPNLDRIQNILQNPTNINLYQAFSPKPYSDDNEIYFKGIFKGIFNLKRVFFNAFIYFFF